MTSAERRIIGYFHKSDDEYKEQFQLSVSKTSSTESISSHPLVLIVLILVNEIALQSVIYFVGLLSSAYLTALGSKPETRDLPAFRWLVIRSFALVALNAFLKSLSTFLSSLLYVKWRTRMVLYLHSFYFTKQRYYHLLNTTQQNSNQRQTDQSTIYENYSVQTTDVDDNGQEFIDDHPSNGSPTLLSTKPPIDNPDQRITQDVDSLCRSLSGIIPLILISPLTIGYYAYRTWKVTGFYGPLGILLYFVVWTGINKIFISSVSRTIFRQDICEGNFRFLHTQIRTYNEPIAFYDGGPFEHRRFDSYFLRSLTPILYRRSIQEFFLELSINLYNYIGSIISYLLLALAIFVFHLFDNKSSTELVEIVSQTSFVAMYLIYRFNLLNEIASEMTSIAANTHRVAAFVQYMKDIDTTLLEKNVTKPEEQHEVLVIRNLTYSTPNNPKRILMKNLNLTLNEGQRLLVTGDSGVGKTSVFRVLHSIWPVNINGSFSYQTTGAYMLPQRPYFTNQSLYDELFYPNTQVSPTIADQTEIEHLLIEWDLSHILDCVELSIFVCPKYAWQDLLSPGELQRLSFVRLLVRLVSSERNVQSRLNLVFLDEITSSLDEKMERRMYNHLLERHLTLVSIGHRETLRKYHQLELKLFKNGHYTMESLPLLE